MILPSLQAEGLWQLSPDTAVSGAPVSPPNGQAEGLLQVRIDSIDGLVAGQVYAHALLQNFGNSSIPASARGVSARK